MKHLFEIKHVFKRGMYRCVVCVVCVVCVHVLSIYARACDVLSFGTGECQVTSEKVSP